jgi:hypothetical protein
VKRLHSDSSTPSLEKQQPKKKPGTLKWRLGCIRKLQQYSAWRDLPGHRHGKLSIGRPCKKRADDLLKLSRHQLKSSSCDPHRTCSCEEAPVYYGPVWWGSNLQILQWNSAACYLLLWGVGSSAL